MSAIHERMVDRYVKHPDSTVTDYWGNGVPLDSHTAMLLASNAAHLALESQRQLVWDASASTYTGKDTWSGLADASGPTETDLASATGAYSYVSWAPNCTRRYGPFVAICDRQASTGELVLRRIRGRIRWTGTGGGTGPTVTAISVALTTHASPQALVQGDCIAFSRFTEPTAAFFSTTVGIDWSASLADRTREVLVCRRGASGSVGPTSIYVTLVWIWVAMLAGSGASVENVSFWEST